MDDKTQEWQRRRPGETHELARISSRAWAAYIHRLPSFGDVSCVLAYIFCDGFNNWRQMLRSIMASGWVGRILSVIYHWYFWTRRNGQTPGKFALGIRVIKADGTPINDMDAVIRAIGYNVSWIFFGLGYLWAIFDKDKQSWHDKMARTYVVTQGRTERHTVDV